MYRSSGLVGVLTAERTPPRRSRTRRAGWRRPACALGGLTLLGGLIYWLVSLQLVGAADPYGVGALAVARFHQQYPRAIPLSVRVARTNVGWIGECEGLALLQGEWITQGVLRPNGMVLLGRQGRGHGLWIVDAEVARGPRAPGVRPPWPQLLPFGPSHPLWGDVK